MSIKSLALASSLVLLSNSSFSQDGQEDTCPAEALDLISSTVPLQDSVAQDVFISLTCSAMQYDITAWKSLELSLKLGNLYIAIQSNDIKNSHPDIQNFVRRLLGYTHIARELAWKGDLRNANIIGDFAFRIYNAGRASFFLGVSEELSWIWLFLQSDNKKIQSMIDPIIKSNALFP